MRNVFHQYSQAENRVTHALMTALDEDRVLLRHFLRDLLGCRTIDAKTALVLEQTYPGAPEFDEVEAERRGIPDGWVCGSGDTAPCVVIESKVTAPLSSDQLKRHRRIAERCSFKSVTTVVIAPDVPQKFPADVRLEWRTVYSFLKRHAAPGSWAKRAAEYLEIAEAQLIAAEKLMQGTLTRFSGFPFGLDHPFVLRLRILPPFGVQH